jgi:hypothetical protein
MSMEHGEHGEHGVSPCMEHGAVLADVQLALQIFNLLLICGSEDVDGTTNVAGMTHIQFSGDSKSLRQSISF